MLRDVKVWARRASECRNPIILGQAFGYEVQRLKLLRLAVGVNRRRANQLLREIEDDAAFVGEIQACLSKWTPYSPRAIDFMMYPGFGSVLMNEVTLYVIIRALRPAVVIETGGTPGKSTAFILRAMEMNGRGHLYTIDLPPAVTAGQLEEGKHWHEQRPENLPSNWVVPDRLRDRHTLLLGSSREHLPKLLASLDRVDVFLHDSDHSYENMTWEFETAFPMLGSDGLLLSDDVLANDSFFDFCRGKGLPFAHMHNLGAAIVR